MRPALTAPLVCARAAGKLNGGNNPLNPYVNNVNASNVAAQLVQAGSAATGLARCASSRC